MSRTFNFLLRQSREPRPFWRWFQAVKERRLVLAATNAALIHPLSSTGRRVFPRRCIVAFGLGAYLLSKNWDLIKSSFHGVVKTSLTVKCQELTGDGGGDSPPSGTPVYVPKLFQEAKRGNHFEVRRLLSGDATRVDVANARHPLGWTALHVAAVNGRYGVVEALLEAGADPDAKEEFSTAFRVARTKNLNSMEVCFEVKQRNILKAMNDAMMSLLLKSLSNR